MDAAVAAADRKHGADGRVGPRGEEGAGTHVGRTREVPLAREHVIVEDRLESEAPNFLETGVEVFSSKRTGGSNDRDPIARPESPGLSHAYANLAISAATA
jgi:hypothetical protein